MSQMVHATDSRVQWEIQAGSPTFHHQKPFPLFDATSAAHLHERTDSPNVWCVELEQDTNSAPIFFRRPLQLGHEGHCCSVMVILLLLLLLFFFFYFLRHDKIWLFKCEPLSAMAFYLTSSELVLWQLLGKPTVACSIRIAVYPEGLCSVFILPVWNLTRTLTTKWILVCYPGKTSPQQPHSWQGKHALGDIDWESASQLC